MMDRRRLGRARKSLGKTKRATQGFLADAFAPLGRAIELRRALRTRAEIASFKQRGTVARRFPGPPSSSVPPRVVAVVTHVSDPARTTEESAHRLGRTLDALLESLGYTELALVLNTIPGRHVAAALPDHLRSRLAVREREGAEPLLLGFEAQQEFVQRADDADWFLYTEDDLVLSDGLLLEKLAFFNAGAPTETLLLPHRYEFWQGKKVYIDLVYKVSPEHCPWNRLTELEVGDWKFAEFENPHSGFYCLSREQLRHWLATGRHWYGKISYVASRESAATGCLGEAFRLYKPHPASMNYLEIRHWDTKYSELYDRLHNGVASAR